MEKTEDKESNVNLYKEIDYPYSSAKDVMLEVVEYIERRIKGPNLPVEISKDIWLSLTKREFTML